MKVEFQSVNNNRDTRYWSFLLSRLKTESGFDKYDDTYYTWLFDTYKIRVIEEQLGICSKALTGLELDESTFTLLLLKYPPPSSISQFYVSG
jgi:hypothetical protein